MHSETIINILYKKLIGGKPTADELEILRKWIEESPQTRKDLVDKMSDRGSITQEYRLREHIDTVRPYNDMCERLGLDRESITSTHNEELETEEYSDTEPQQKDGFRNRLSRLKYLDVLKYAAAVAIVSVTLLYFALPKRSDGSHVTPAGQTLAVADKKPMTLDRLSPGKSRAVIILPGGDTIRLSDPGSRSLKATKSVHGGKLQLDVPRGGEFAIVLEDSTKVWLNSESKLFYPAHFSGTERNVELIGEAYFEVAHQSDRPFTVETSGQKVTVYGTEFNIRSYPEEKSVYTTLSNGSIGLSRLDGTGGEIRLSPGKQAVFDKKTSSAKVRQVDIERVTGWRHGRFVFEEQSLLQIMTDLSRWYDFEFEFADQEAAETIFMGSIPRYCNFKTAIAILEKSGGLIFSVKNNKVIISKE